jgi:hypothetical protein
MSESMSIGLSWWAIRRLIGTPARAGFWDHLAVGRIALPEATLWAWRSAGPLATPSLFCR